MKSGKYFVCGHCGSECSVEDDKLGSMRCGFCGNKRIIIDRNVKGYDGVNSDFRIEKKKTMFGSGIEYVLENYTGSAKKVVIPDIVTQIGSGAFTYNNDIEEVVFPDGVTTISKGAFFDCENLKSINIPSSLGYIAEQSFSGCVSLSNVSLPINVRVHVNAFFKCKKLVEEWCRDGRCPYCGLKLKRGLFKKICKRCGIFPSNITSEMVY